MERVYFGTSLQWNELTFVGRVYFGTSLLWDEFAMERVNYNSNLGETSSGPVALCGLSWCNSLKTSNLVIVMLATEGRPLSYDVDLGPNQVSQRQERIF